MENYYVGNAILKGTKEEGPALIYFDGSEYVMKGFGSSLQVLADVIIASQVDYKNIHLSEVDVLKIKSATVTPLLEDELKELKAEIKRTKKYGVLVTDRPLEQILK